MEKEFTSKETALKLRVARRTVNQWCKSGILSATRKQTDFGEEYWSVKESVLNAFNPPRRGRKPKISVEMELKAA